MAKDPWEVVSVEPISKDPWEVVSVDDLPKEESFFSLDRAKRVAKDVVSLIPGMEDVAEPKPKAEPQARMTPQQMERTAANDAAERENLRAINPKAEDYQINALLEQRRAARANQMPAPTLGDRAAGYLENSATMSEADAQRNAAFDLSLEQRMNRKFQEAEADPISGGRIAVAYQPEREAERTAAAQAEMDAARVTATTGAERARVQAERDAWNPVVSDGVDTLTKGIDGALLGFQAITDAFGAKNPVSGAIQKARDFYGVLYSSEQREADQRTGEILEGAGDGILAQLKAAAQAYLVDPVGMTSQSLGIMAPMLLGGKLLAGTKAIQGLGAVGARALGVAGSTTAAATAGASVTGGVMGAGFAKGAIYDSVYEMARKEGYSEADAKAVADKAQGYTENPDVIALVALATAAGAGTGAEPLILNMLGRESAKTLLRQGIIKAPLVAMGKEMPLEMLQGGSEKFASNVAGMRAGFDVEPMQGVWANAFLEGLAAGPVAGGAGLASSNGRLTGDTAADYQARVLSDALGGGEFAPTDVVDILRQESSLTGGEMRPEATVVNAGRQAQVQREREQLEAMRTQQTQNTRAAEASIGSVTLEQTGGDLAAATNEVIRRATDAVDQGVALSDITNRVNQADQLAATIGALTASAAPAAAPAADGQAQPTLTYPTAEAAQADAEQQGVADRVQVMDTGDGFVLAPKVNAPTVKQLRDESLAVSGLQAAIPANGNLSYRGGWTVRQDDSDAADRGRSGQAASAVQLVASVAGQAFGVAPVPVTGLGAFGVAYNGRLFVDVDEVVAGGMASQSSDAALGIATIGHEATHALLERSSNPEDRKAYANFKAVVLQYARPGVIESRRQSEEAAAGGPAQAGTYGSTQYAEGEVVADVSGAMWLDTKFWQRLYEVDNGSTMRRVLYKFMQAATRFMEVAKGSRLDAARFVTNVDAVREAAAQAWASRARNQQPPKELEGLPQFSSTAYNVNPDGRRNEQPTDQGRGTGSGSAQDAGQSRSERSDGGSGQGSVIGRSFGQSDSADGRQRPAIRSAVGRESARAGQDDAGLSPLPGAPTVDPVRAGTTAGPDPRLVAVAEQYARSNGIDLRRQAEYAEVDEDRARRIAQAYDSMPHAPQDPAVREAYENLIRQTVAQYRALEQAGYRFWFFGNDNDPYSGNPWAAMADLRENQTMAVYATAAGFGSSADFNPEDNPLLADTGIRWPSGSLDGELQPVYANDLFRAVHDAFGHGLEGAGFRARGEENAWQAHVRLFTGSAVAAITSETRGQNSWLNYGPVAEANRTASVFDTVFADQKTGLMPEWTWTEGRVGDYTGSTQQESTNEKTSQADAKDPAYSRTDAGSGRAGPGQIEGQDRVRDGAGRSDAQRSGGAGAVDGSAVRASGRPEYGTAREGAVSAVGYHFSRQSRTSLNANFYGSGLKGLESERLQGNADIRPRIFFYVDRGNGVRPEAGVGGFAHSVKLNNLYDVWDDPLGIVRSTRGMPDRENAWERAIVEAGFDGYVKRDPVMPQHFAVLIGRKHDSVPVAAADPRRADGQANAQPIQPTPKSTTRAEGDELVRRPEGMELGQIVRVREEVKFAAPSFRLQYGEARVLTSEAELADRVLADAGSSFQFGVPQFSMADDFDELGAFNLDANDEQLEWSEDFADGLEVAEKDDLDFDALQAELDTELNQSRARPAVRGSIEEPTDQQLKDAGLHAEAAIDFGPHELMASTVTLSAPSYLQAQQYLNYEISRFGGEFTVRTEVDDYATFISGGKRLSEKLAVQFAQNQLAADYLHKRFDLADVYRKSTVMKIAEGWKAMARVEGAFKFQNSETKSKSFPEVAAALGLFKDYRVSVEYDELVTFKHRQSGRQFEATLIERGVNMACCTMGLNGSDLGVPFYVVAGKVAQNIGKPFVADETLSAINTLRRTEQALSFALRTGDTGVLLPGPQNRVYGYNNEPKTTQDHNENLARLALANLRNVEELVPEVRRWTYDPATGKFGDEAKVDAALKDPDVRAMGVGRTTIARAVLTNQMVMNTLQPGEIEAMAAPVLYSRITREEDPQPLSESWGQLSADGSVELTPQFKAWFGDSKVVDAEGKPLVVYHGTAKDVSAFDLGAERNMAAFRDAQGFYFTNDPRDASAYTEDRSTGDPADGANIMPVFLQMENPLRVEVGDIDNHPAYISPKRRAELEAKGHDGLIYADGVEFVVFRPEQIKSAVGNNGDFDPANPDIRYSRKDVESYMAQRNRSMRQVSAGSEQRRDMDLALAAMQGLADQMKPVYERLSERLSGDELKKAVMAEFRDFVLPVGRTPHVLTMLGGPNSMMKIDPSIVFKVFVDKHAGDLEGARAKDIIEAIYRPAMVLRGTNKNEMELVLPIVTSTGPLTVPVLLNAELMSSKGFVSAIMSIYPRKVSLGGNSVLQRIKDGKLAYADPALAQVALTGNASPQAGINVREAYVSTGTPPARTSTDNVADAAKLVKPLNPYYVGWDKAKDDILGGIAAKKVKSDLGLMRWIGDNFRGDWQDAPAFSRTPLSPNYKLDPENRWLKTQRTFQDYFNRVQRVQQMVADQGGTVREENNTYRAEERSYGRIHEQVKEFADKWVRPMVEKAAKAGVTMDELSLYAYAMHAKERNARIARINPNLKDGGSGMTDAEADAIIARVKADPRAQAMADLHGDLMAITATTRRVLLEDGLITDEQFAQLDGMYQHYVPLRGFENESDPRIQQLLEEGGSRLGTGQGFSIRGNETLRALGRRTKAGDIIENIINDYQRAVVRGEKNAVARTFYQFVLDNPSPNLWEIDADKTKRSLGLDGMVKEKVVLDKDDSTTVAVKLQGNEVFIKVKDPLLVRAMKKMHNDDMGDQLRTITNGLNVYTSLMRNTLTRFNPEFAIVNLVRDAGFGTLAVLDELGEAGVAKFWRHYAAANASSHRYEMGNLDPVNNEMDRYFTEYRMAGGTTGGFYMKDADQVRSDIRDLMLAAGASPTNWVEKVKTFGGKASPYQAALKAGKVLEHIGAVSENAARVAAYRAAREMGRTPAEAAKIAKNLTTNFNRKGEYGQLLNSLFVFFNAAVQGAERTIKLMRNRRVQGYLAGMVASSMAIALLNAWGAGDDEDDGEAYWDKIPDHVKERNLIIMLPPGTQEGEQVGSNGRYLAIPVQYGLNVFTTLGYGMADMLRHYGQDKTRGRDALKAGLDLASVTFGSFNPFGGSVDNKHAAAMIVLPSAADVVYQLANGVNAFGTPVAPFKSELDAKPDSENVNARQAGGPAHEIARWLNSATGGDDTVAGWVDVSPGTLENVWTSLTGGTGRFINDVATLGLNSLEYANGGDPDIYINKVPVFRKVYGEVDGAVDQGLFYDRRRQIQEARQEVKGKEESGREVADSEVIALDSMASDANKFTRAVSDIRKQMIEIGKDPDMTPTEKRTLIRELKAERDSLTREFNKMFIETMRAEAAGDFAAAE